MSPREEKAISQPQRVSVGRKSHWMTFMRFKIVGAALLAGTIAATALAQELPQAPHITKAAARNEAPLMRSTDPGAARFLPVGKLLSGSLNSTNCTATLIAADQAPASDRPALILTAGHCVETMDDNKVIVDIPAHPAWRYTPAYFIDTQENHVSFGIEKVLYATMKSVDIAVLQLNATYGDLADAGVMPMLLKPTTASSDMSIELAHIPIIGVDEKERFLRHSLCDADASHSIYEGGNPWYWLDAVPNDCVGVAGGTSGSPVVLRGQAAVIGILNTTVDPDFNGCGLGRPCELTGDTGVPREGVSYYIPVDRIAQALNSDSTLDLQRLDDGQGVALTRNGQWTTQGYKPIDIGPPRPSFWNLRVGTEFEQIRYKLGHASALACADPKGYGPPVSTSTQPLVHLATSDREGVYGVCVIGKRQGESAWQSASNATIKLREIDDTPPTLTPYFDISYESDTEWHIYAKGRPNEVSKLFIKYGPRNEADCNAEEGYIPVPGIPVILSKKDAPWRFCAKGFDLADHPSPAAHRDFE